MDNWDEIRTAYQVARKGTVSGAAEVLGVHHATVIRHIDALEKRLGVKLFQRHARGYTATEPGMDLLQVAQTTDDQFSQLAGRIRGQGEEVTGQLVVTSLPIFSTRLVPVLVDFQLEHPELTVRFLTGDRLFRLEYGEAHVAIRSGSPPQEPDNVVQPFVETRMALFAHRSYVERMGPLKSEADVGNHRFVGADSEGTRAPFYRWMDQVVPRNRVTFRTSSNAAMYEAVKAGAGIGFLDSESAETEPDLLLQMPARDDWMAPSWLVTHVDLHRTPKVQAFLKFLKARAKVWANGG